MATPAPPSWRPSPLVLKATAYAGCALVLATAAWLVVQIIGALALVVFPLVVTAFLTRILAVPSQWLRRRGWRPAPAAVASIFGFLLLIALLGVSIAEPMISEFRDLGDALADGLTEVEDWVVDDSGLDITRTDVKDAKDDIGDRVDQALRDSSEQIFSGARLALTGLAGLILSLILTFFALKDGPDAVERVHRGLPEARRRDVEIVARASWDSLGGYLRGASLLGVVEALIIGGAMALLGTGLVLPVMLLTFAAAFVPLVGATVAGAVAVLVTLATGGVTQALIVGVVAVLVQQFDNDLLAPWIYGKALALHPVTILLAITTGTAAFGFVGTVLAVPLTAVVTTSFKALREARGKDPLPVGLGPDPDLEAEGS